MTRRRLPPLTDAQKQALLDAYSAGTPTKLIAHEFGVSKSYITKLAGRSGLALRKNGKPLDLQDKQRILHMYDAGYGIVEIAKAVRRAASTVSSILANEGMHERRKRGQRHIGDRPPIGTHEYAAWACDS